MSCKGTVDLNLLESTMKWKNAKFITIVYLAGKDLMPTKLHRLNNKTHICLDTYWEKECFSLVEILSK